MEALVLDDDELGRRTMVAMLEALGYRVFAAGSVAEGMAVVYLRELTVLLTDWNLQGEHPTELLTVVRELSPRCRRVVLSGASRTASGYDGDDVEMWLTKPVPLQALRAALSE